jgi:uncharacterized protein (DUF433 family)
MNQEQLLDRIEINPDILAGQPIIKGTRLSVQYILACLIHKLKSAPKML